MNVSAIEALNLSSSIFSMPVSICVSKIILDKLSEPEKSLEEKLILSPSVTENPKFIKSGKKVKRPKINMLGNKNKYGKLFVPLSLCANSIGHPITDISLEIFPMTPLDSKNPINK
jgi:hypothetical protein